MNENPYNNKHVPHSSSLSVMVVRSTRVALPSSSETPIDRWAKRTTSRAVEKRVGSYPFWNSIGHLVCVRVWVFSMGGLSETRLSEIFGCPILSDVRIGES